jgi:hypothetical protein
LIYKPLADSKGFGGAESATLEICKGRLLAMSICTNLRDKEMNFNDRAHYMDDKIFGAITRQRDNKMANINYMGEPVKQTLKLPLLSPLST